MASGDQEQERNRLLRALPPAEYQRLLAHLTPVPLPFRQMLFRKDQPIEEVYFVRSGVVSMVTLLEDGTIVEVATIGNEGMVGLPAYLGADSIALETFVQVPGDGLRMATGALREEVANGGALGRLLQRYTQAIFVQIAQGVACNRIHTIEERLARWLLQTQDRVGAPEFPLTQEFIAQMLGVRRPSVNLAARTLQQAGLIRYTRGKITILDRAALESAACECYALIQQEYNRLPD